MSEFTDTYTKSLNSPAPSPSSAGLMATPSTMASGRGTLVPVMTDMPLAGTSQSILLSIFAFKDDMLYLKADAETRAEFEKRNLPQFTYQKKDKTIGLPYFQAPEEIFDDRQEAAIWLKRAFEASLRSKPKGKH